MSQLFVVPLVQINLTDFQGNQITRNVPEYSTDSGDPLYGVSFNCMPLTGAGIALVATAPNPALADESDCFAFPSNGDLTTQMTNDDIASLTTVLQNVNVPTDFLVSPITYAQAARTIGQIAQTLQMAAGAGNPVQLGGVSQGAGRGVGEIGGSSNTDSELLAVAAEWSSPLILGLDLTL
jgi:hypothetical protein